MAPGRPILLPAPADVGFVGHPVVCQAKAAARCCGPTSSSVSSFPVSAPTLPLILMLRDSPGARIDAWPRRISVSGLTVCRPVRTFQRAYRHDVHAVRCCPSGGCHRVQLPGFHSVFVSNGDTYDLVGPDDSGDAARTRWHVRTLSRMRPASLNAVTSELFPQRWYPVHPTLLQSGRPKPMGWIFDHRLRRNGYWPMAVVSMPGW